MWLRLATVVVCLFLVPFTLAETQTVTLYNTNPRISYTPDITCIPRRFVTWPPWRKCRSKNNPWSLHVYIDALGHYQSMHSATSYRNDNGGGGVREISFNIQASRILIFGAPRSQIGLLPANQELCIDQHCTSIDTQGIYSRAESADSPVLIYEHHQLDQNQGHHFVLRMTEHPSGRGHPQRVMTLDRIVYQFESPADVVYSLPPGHWEKNITMHDTDRRVKFQPYGVWGRALYDLMEDSTMSKKSYKYSATTYPRNKGGHGNQRASFKFKGSALYLYGAPPSQIQYPHGSLEICVDRACHVIDAHHLYLNLRNGPPSSIGWEDQPVLLWSSDKLDPGSWHDVVYKLTEANPKYPADQGGIIKGITFDSVICTEVHSPPYPWLLWLAHYPWSLWLAHLKRVLVLLACVIIAGCGITSVCLLVYLLLNNSRENPKDRQTFSSSDYPGYGAVDNQRPPLPKAYDPYPPPQYTRNIRSRSPSSSVSSESPPPSYTSNC